MTESEKADLRLVLRDLKYVLASLEGEHAKLTRIDDLTFARHGITRTPKNPEHPTWGSHFTFADGSSASGKLPSKELTWGINGHITSSTKYMIRKVEALLAAADAE